MAKVFQKGDNVVLYIPLPDEATLGTPIASATYFVYDMNGTAVIDGDNLPLDNISIGTFGSEVILNIPPINPATMPIIEGSPRAFFRVLVRFVADSGFVHQHHDEFYYEDVLVDLDPYVNAFANYGYIMSLAGSRADLGAFLDSEETDRISALCQSFEDIKAMPLVITRDNTKFANELGDFKVIESLQSGIVTLTPDEKRTFSLAQCQQANYILGGYPGEDNRRQGLVQVAESSTLRTYRTGKILPVPICNVALNTLRRYLKWKVRVGRTG